MSEFQNQLAKVILHTNMHLSCNRDIAMKIVESDYWKEALRSCHVEEAHPAETTPDHSAEVNSDGRPGTVSPEAEINQPPVEVIRTGPHAAAEDIHPRHELHVHPQSHPIETTPLRKLIEEMPGGYKNGLEISL